MRRDALARLRGPLHGAVTEEVGAAPIALSAHVAPVERGVDGGLSDGALMTAAVGVRRAARAMGHGASPWGARTCVEKTHEDGRTDDCRRRPRESDVVVEARTGGLANYCGRTVAAGTGLRA